MNRPLFIQKRVVLQYPPVSVSSSVKNLVGNTATFVGLDDSMPFATTLDRAYKFETREQAEGYNELAGKKFLPREVTITYHFED